ncbi:VRR-NUC domain-containing protein [Roseovarius indicus]|uniref:VRR-NUC domain-containing protein n=1 Tax=Roseovarius indicus TaxID=540747 RepID=UPI0032ED0B10
MSNAETDIHNRILVALSSEFHPRGIFWRQNAGHIRSDRGAWVSLGPTGISDIVGVLDGRSVFVEVKTPTGKQRKAQKSFQAAVEKAGGIYLVARSPEEALASLNKALDRSTTPA